jgi:hypothetical protein
MPLNTSFIVHATCTSQPVPSSPPRMPHAPSLNFCRVDVMLHAVSPTRGEAASSPHPDVPNSKKALTLASLQLALGFMQLHKVSHRSSGTEAGNARPIPQSDLDSPNQLKSPNQWEYLRASGFQIAQEWDFFDQMSPKSLKIGGNIWIAVF